MSYCVFENTVTDLNQILGILQDYDNLKDLKESRSSDYERRAVTEVYETCKEIAEIMEQWIEEDEYEDEEW